MGRVSPDAIDVVVLIQHSSDWRSLLDSRLVGANRLAARRSVVIVEILALGSVVWAFV